jgi:anti-sigma factor RsiW
MTLSRCTREPVSWLRLERYRLGELGDAERARIAEHLAACAACAACMARIEADEALDLPPLALAHPGARRRSSSRGLRWLAGAGVLAAAAAAILVVGRTWRTPGRADVDRREAAHPKGDSMAFVLVRDDGQRVVEAQGVFRRGDRFKALVTCPPSTSATFDLVVFDAAGTSFPLAPARGLACGNEVPLPGAFRLTATSGGSEGETVCVVWGSGDEVDREALARSGVAGRRAMCKELRLAGSGD